MRRIRAGVAVLFLASGLAIQTGGRAGAAPAPASAPHALVTPLLSARRDPAWLENGIVQQRLDAQVTALVRGRFGSAGQPAGCVVVAQGGRTLYQLNPLTELIPASNLKLATSTALLAAMDPSTRLATRVTAARHPVGGVLAGNLYLVGGGDPYLLTDNYDHGLYYPEPTFTSLDALAASVRSAGVTRVTGSVVGDASRYDTQIGIPTWAAVYLAEGDVGPLSALEVDDGSPPPAPPKSTASTAPNPTEPAEGAARPPFTPTLYAAQTFRALLLAHGVAVAGSAATGPSPSAAVQIVQATSPPLATEVQQMLRVSDDTAAELFTKELGYRATGTGTTASGLAQIRKSLVALGVPVGQLVMQDGSGLDRGDRATCGLISGLLQRAGTSGVIAGGLPVAGQTGTLTDRMKGTAAVGRLRAKTGTLDGVAALSGFVTARPGLPTPELSVPLYFSIIINGMDSRQAAPLADQIGVALASYPDLVPIADLGPKG